MDGERGYRRYCCKTEGEKDRNRERERERERECVRRFHGNLSGVCLVPGDTEERRGGER